MKTMEGTVLLVQEGRFMVEAPQGDSHLFILSQRATLEPQQLPAITRKRVRIGYTDGANVIGYVAHSIELLPDRVRS